MQGFRRRSVAEEAAAEVTQKATEVAVEDAAEMALQPPPGATLW